MPPRVVKSAPYSYTVFITDSDSDTDESLAVRTLAVS